MAGSEGRRGITRLDRSEVQGEWRRLWPERRAGVGSTGPDSSRGGFQGVGGSHIVWRAVERN